MPHLPDKYPRSGPFSEVQNKCSRIGRYRFMSILNILKIYAVTSHALSFTFFFTLSAPAVIPVCPFHNSHLSRSAHTSFFAPLLIITPVPGKLHFILSILSLQGWQAGHKLSWRWRRKLEEIVMKISSVCRSDRSCSCQQPCAGGIALGQLSRVCVWMWWMNTCEQL